MAVFVNLIESSSITSGFCYFSAKPTKMKFVFTCLFCAFIISVHGSHLLGGYISYKPIGPPSSYTYEITVVQFTDSGEGRAAHRDELVVDFGDGTRDTIPGHLMKIPVAPNVWRNIYKTKHSYPGDGCYIVSTPLYGEFANLKNATGHVLPVQQSELCISNSFGTVMNSSPELTNMFLFSARTDSVYRYNPSYTEHDTDSVALSPLHLGKGYKWPSEIEPFKNNYQVRSGELIWNKPNVPGRYLLALRHEEYRTTLTLDGRVIEKIGYVNYWWVVNVEGPTKAVTPDSRAFSVLQQAGTLSINHSEIIDGDVMLFDMTGKNVDHTRLINGQCQLQILGRKKGMYTLVLNTEKGIQTKKVMLN